MYLNFSGYTDIVVAAARLIGLTLPENFDRPYLARNVDRLLEPLAYQPYALDTRLCFHDFV